MNKVLSVSETRRLEQTAVERGATYLALMKKAGESAADYACEKYQKSGQKPLYAVVLCGRGNNGGDGFVAARRLLNLGLKAAVILTDGEPQTGDAGYMFQKLRETDAFIIDYRSRPEESLSVIKRAELLFDGIYGIGFHGRICEELEPLVDAVNKSGAKVISLDVPSGVNCDTGAVEGKCIKAGDTVTFSTLKPCHVLYPSSDYCGKTVVFSVGIDEKTMAESRCELWEITGEDVGKTRRERPLSAHKGSFGTLLCVCGSLGLAGAAVLSSKAAARCGVGLLNIALPKSVYPIVAAAAAEPTFTPLSENHDGTLSEECLPRLLKAVNHADACLIGCGLGHNGDTEKIVSVLVKESEVPLVIDADGINSLVPNIDILKTARAPIVLTPHPGEMARLMGTTTAQVQHHRYEVARQFAADFKVTLVLKGANTLIASPDGRVLVNRTGNPGMAKGGSGDVLAGMLGSFLAQGTALPEAAYSSVYLHGLAGDRCASRLSQTAMTPTDMINELPSLFLQYE